jgi:hypothetical protein
MGCDYCSIHLHLHLKKSWIKGTDRWKRVLVVGPVLRPIRKRRSSISLGRSSGLLRLNGRRAGGASRCAIHNCCDLPEHLAAARPLQFRPSIHGEADSDR